jgi:hypothetical protein
VLLVQGEGAGAGSSLYLTTALDVGKAPPFKTEVVPVSRVAPASFEQRSVVILNDSGALSTPAAERLAAFVKAGGGLFIILGERNPLGNDTLLLPGALGAPVDRAGLRGGTLGYLDYSHKVFEPFKDPRNGNFTNVHFFKYRALTPTATDRVLARFDDGAAAVTERRVGDGRVVAFSSTLEAQRWNDFTNRAIFVPLLHEMVKYLAQYEQPEAWYTVGRLLDISQPIGAIVREGRAGAAESIKGATGIVVSPSGDQSTLGAGGAPSIELAEQGFYSVRLQSAADRKPFAVAVNLDGAESDLSALSPAISRLGHRSRRGDGDRSVARASRPDARGHREEAIDLVVPAGGRRRDAAGRVGPGQSPVEAIAAGLEKNTGCFFEAFGSQKNTRCFFSGQHYVRIL